MRNLPGGELSTRPLHFIWIADCSGSMGAEGKVQALNNAVHETLPEMRRVADENPNATVLVRALAFSSGARWITAEPQPIDSFSWSDLTAGGVTDLGKALTLVAEQMRMPPMTDRALPPVLVLISDGQPTDDFAAGLKALMEQPWGRKAVRIAIAIGADADEEALQSFIGNSEIPPLKASNPESLVRYIRWVSTAVLQAASAPNSQAATSLSPVTNVPVPAAPAPNTAADVW